MFPSVSPQLMSWHGFLTKPGAYLDRLVGSKFEGYIGICCLYCPRKHPQLLHGAGDLNTGHHAYTADTFPEPSPLPIMEGYTLMCDTNSSGKVIYFVLAFFLEQIVEFF